MILALYTVGYRARPMGSLAMTIDIFVCAISIIASVSEAINRL